MGIKTIVVFVLCISGIIGAVLLWLRAPHDAHRAAARVEPSVSVADPHRSLRPAELIAEAEVSSEASTDQPLFVSGTVVDQEGRLVDGARVVFDADGSQVVTESAGGSFLAENLTARPYLVFASLDDGASRPMQVFPKDSTLDVTLTLLPSPALEVLVTSARDDRPVSGATVGLGGRSGTTDAAGKALLRGIGSGRKLVRVSAHGFGTTLVPTEVPGEGSSRETLHVALLPGASVSGVVRDEHGRPVAGARVTGENAASVAEVAATDDAISDEQGRFTLVAVPPGSYRFRAEHPELVSATTPPLAVDEVFSSAVELRMLAGGRVSGQVIASGASREPILVRFIASDGGFGQPKHRDVRCDAQGFFSAGGLPRTALQAVAARRGESSRPVRVDLKSTDVVSGLRMELDSGGSIRGIVVSKDEQPVAGALISAEPLNQPPGARAEASFQGPLLATTNERGEFKLLGLTAREYAVFALPPGSAGAGSALRDGYRVRVGATIKIRLPNDGAIRGSVQLPDGRPVGAFAVSVDGSAPLSVGFNRSDFLVDAVSPGEHTVTISGEFASKVITGVRVPSDGVAELGKVVVDGGASVAGQVVGADGRPVSFATVMVAQNFVGDGTSLSSTGTRLETDQRRTSTDAEGKFELRGLGSTARYIAAEHPTKGRAGVRPLLLSSAPIVLALEATGSIHGRVTSGGDPLEGVLLAATTNVPTPGELPSQAIGALTGPSGEYLIDKVPPGSYKLVAMKREDGSAGGGKVVEATVASSKSVKVDLDLPAGSVTLVVRSDESAEAQAERQLVLSGPTSQVSELGPGAEARFAKLTPGEYVLCATRLGDTAKRSPSCRGVHVDASPAVQELTLD